MYHDIAEIKLLCSINITLLKRSHSYKIMNIYPNIYSQPQYKDTWGFILSLILSQHFNMNRNNNILENTYFNLSKAGKLYRVLKSKGITHIGKHKVRKWLQSQDDYSLRREQRHSFRKVRVVVSGIDDQFDGSSRYI